VWAIEAAISWLNENNQGYVILQKIFNSEELDEQEKGLARKMYIGKYALVAEDEDCNINGLTLFGYMILQRYKRGQTHIQFTAHN
jgi:hypothetical protein